ncbi:MAG: non-homologous end joining protein Ku [Bacillota bacterium]
MHTVWKGAISFGLVSIPIKLFAATETKNIRFNFLHDQCKTPIRYEKVCPVCDREVTNDEIVRGYEYEKGKYVVLKDEDLENLPLNTLKTIDILDFVDLHQVDPIYYLKAYYLAPGELGYKPYRLLYQALQETGKAAIAKVTLRARESLALLRVYHNCLMMETMFYPDEIRSTDMLPELTGEVPVHANELKMAINLIENLSAAFEPGKYTSDYRQALQELIQTKVTNEEIEVPLRPEGAKVLDLMEALRASVKATKEQQRPKTAADGRKKKKTTAGVQ